MPVFGRDRNVLGGLFFGHANIGVLEKRSETIVAAIAGHAGIALENAQTSQGDSRNRKPVHVAC